MDTKKCTKCGIERPVDVFGKCKTTKSGLQSWCRPCVAAASKRWAATERGKEITRQRGVEWREANPGRWRLQSYGMTVEQFEARLAEQGGVCAICGTTEHGGTNWHVDHDHTCCPGKRCCGKCVRGLLCLRCNTKVVPLVEDASDLLERATRYVAKWAGASA